MVLFRHSGYRYTHSLPSTPFLSPVTTPLGRHYAFSIVVGFRLKLVSCPYIQHITRFDFRLITDILHNHGYS